MTTDDTLAALHSAVHSGEPCSPKLHRAAIAAGVRVAPSPDAPEGPCCENGNFGDGHECRKSSPDALRKAVSDFLNYDEDGAGEDYSHWDEKIEAMRAALRVAPSPDALREAARLALDLLPDLSVAYHQVGSIRDHADPKDRTGWNVHGIETCDDSYCLDALAAIDALRAALQPWREASRRLIANGDDDEGSAT